MTEKQIAFANDIKAKIVNEVNEAISIYGDDDNSKNNLVNWLNSKNNAKWWIRHKDYTYSQYVDECRIELSEDYTTRHSPRPTRIMNSRKPFLTDKQNYLVEILYRELDCVNPLHPRIKEGFDYTLGTFNYFNKTVDVYPDGKVTIYNRDYEFSIVEFKAGTDIDLILEEIKKNVF